MDLVPIGTIVKNDFNIVTISEVEIYRYSLILKTYGVLNSLIVCPSPKIIDQNPDALLLIDGQLYHEAYKRAGIKFVPVINVGLMSTRDAKMLHIKLNLLDKEIDEAELAFAIGEFNKDTNINDLCNKLNLKKDEIEHYIDLYNFSLENYIKKNDAQVSLFGN